jgi:AcrR family transcriptional regulator
VSPKAKPDQAALRDNRRGALIAAARDLFAQRGYHDTTVDDITRAAGVAKGTFYLYFEEKREVYHEVIRSFMQLIKEIGASVGAPGTSPLDYFVRAEACANELMQIFFAHRQLARMAYREAMGLDPELETMIRDFYREIAQVAARNVQVAIDLGIIRKCDPTLVAYAHIGMIERVLLAMASNPADFPPPRQVVRDLMRLAFDGLRIPGGVSPFGD